MIHASNMLSPFRLRKGLFVFFYFLLGATATSLAQSATNEKLTPGHSHNDYLQNEPLFNALTARMRSVEADVHLIKGELYVSHIRPLFRRKNRTLRVMYLDPLMEWVREHGFVYQEEPLLLLIDIKTDAEATYAALDTQLADYEQMLYTWQEGVPKPGAVKIVLSGNRPVNAVKTASFRRVALDGRGSDFKTEIDPELTPLISTSARSLDTIRPARAKNANAIREELRAYATQANAGGIYFRVWGAPDRPWFWEAALDAGIELVNTDKPRAFRNFVENRKKR